MHLAVRQDEQVDAVRLRLDEALERRWQQVRRSHEQLKQRRELGLDHLAPLILHFGQVALELVHPAAPARQLLVDANPRGVDLVHLHLQQKVVGKLIEHALELGVVEHHQRLEGARDGPCARLELHLHGAHPLLERLDRVLMPRLAGDEHLLHTRVVGGGDGRHHLAVILQRLGLANRHLLLRKRRHGLPLAAGHVLDLGWRRQGGAILGMRDLGRDELGQEAELRSERVARHLPSHPRLGCRLLQRHRHVACGPHLDRAKVTQPTEASGAP